MRGAPFRILTAVLCSSVRRFSARRATTRERTRPFAIGFGTPGGSPADRFRGGFFFLRDSRRNFMKQKTLIGVTTLALASMLPCGAYAKHPCGRS